jgi:hypothetical protein
MDFKEWIQRPSLPEGIEKPVNKEVLAAIKKAIG